MLAWDRRLGSGNSSAKAIVSKFESQTSLWSCSAACFASAAQKVAVGAEDGTVMVFDARNFSVPLLKDVRNEEE